MEKMKLRCHFSIIFENLWQFWLVIIIMLVQQVKANFLWKFLCAGGLISGWDFPYGMGEVLLL